MNEKWGAINKNVLNATLASLAEAIAVGSRIEEVEVEVVLGVDGDRTVLKVNRTLKTHNS